MSEEVWSHIQQAIDEDRLAHGYILDGSPLGAGQAFAMKMVQYLFSDGDDRAALDSDACRRIEARTHPDVLWVEPRSKSRRILVEQMEEAIHRVQQSSFEGGWKVCVITYAETMNAESANKFLKTLEEPPARTLLLLVSDQVTSILPTIRSRCQRVMLPREQSFTQQPWMEPILTILRSGPPGNTLDLLVQARAFEDIFTLARKEIEAEVREQLGDEEADDKVIDARVKARSLETWQTMLQFIQAWHRDLMLLVSDAGNSHLYFPEEEMHLQSIADSLTFARAHAKLAEVEKMAYCIARNLPVQEVFESGLAV